MGPAPAAFSAADYWASRDAVPNREILNSWPQRNDLTRHLMANDDRRPHPGKRMRPVKRNVERPSQILMEVCPANAAPCYLNLDLPWRRCVWLSYSFNADILTAVPHRS